MSISSRLKPRRSVQRMYMRSSISAQSCDSVPPAPGWMVIIALLRSCSPPSIFLVSPAVTSAASSSRPAARSSATGSPAWAHSASTARSSTRRLSESLREASTSIALRRCSSFCAAAWSFQKSGSPTRCSILASSSAGRAASKIAPQIGCALGEILIPAELLVELKSGHDSAVLLSYLAAPPGAARTRSRCGRGQPAAASLLRVELDIAPGDHAQRPCFDHFARDRDAEAIGRAGLAAVFHQHAEGARRDTLANAREPHRPRRSIRVNGNHFDRGDRAIDVETGDVVDVVEVAAGHA